MGDEQDTPTTESNERLAALIRYIVHKYPGISAARLCVLCFLCDYEHYETFGKTITGVEYINLPEDSEEWRELEKRHYYPAPQE